MLSNKRKKGVSIFLELFMFLHREYFYSLKWIMHILDTLHLSFHSIVYRIMPFKCKVILLF